MPGVARRCLLSSFAKTVTMAVASHTVFTLAAQASVKANGGGGKFFADGRVRPFPGNTIICHLPQQGQENGAFKALLDIYRSAPGLGFLRNTTLLPPSSYHMTVFEGATENSRNKPGKWPADLSPAASMAECGQYLANQLKGFRLGFDLPIRMRVDMDAPIPNGGALTIPLKSIDDEEEQKVRYLRARLSAATGILTPSPDTYKFHISLAYWITHPSMDEEADYSATHLKWREAIQKTVPVINLGAPEYCLFEDMFAFDRQFYIGD